MNNNIESFKNNFTCISNINNCRSITQRNKTSELTQILDVNFAIDKVPRLVNEKIVGTATSV